MSKIQNHQTVSTSIKATKKFLKDQGNIHDETLTQIIVSPMTGKPDRLAIDLYCEARSWFRPKATKRNGNVIYSSKLIGKGWRTGYKSLAKKHVCTTESIRKKFVLLEGLGLLSRDFAYEFSHGRVYNNCLNILVWKDTPFFYSEIGLERVETTQPNLEILPIKEGGSLQPEFDSIYSNPNNRTKEIEDSSYRAISSISKKEINNKEKVIQSSDLLAACSAASQSPCTNVEVSKKEPKLVDPANPVKPRIVVTAAMQNGTAQLPLPLQASGLTSPEVATTVAEFAPPTMLTLEQEREQFKTHRYRSHHQQPDAEPKPIGAIILSLLPKLTLAANSDTKTHQKGEDFQLTVEHSKACSTVEQGTEPKVIEETEPKIEHATIKSEAEEKSKDVDDEFRLVLAEKAERNAVWQGILNKVTQALDEIHDPLIGKMRAVTMKDMQGQFGSMNYKVDLETKRVKLQAKSELWIPAFELVYAAKFREAASEAGYSFELVRTLEDKR